MTGEYDDYDNDYEGNDNDGYDNYNSSDYHASNDNNNTNNQTLGGRAVGSSSSSSSSSPSAELYSSVTPPPPPPVHIRLSHLASVVASKAAEQRILAKQEADEKDKRECTFQPALTKKGRDARRGEDDDDEYDFDHSRNRRSGTPNSNKRDIGARLYKDADMRNVVRECTRYHLQEAEMAEYTFKPKIIEGKVGTGGGGGDRGGTICTDL